VACTVPPRGLGRAVVPPPPSACPAARSPTSAHLEVERAPTLALVLYCPGARAGGRERTRRPENVESRRLEVSLCIEGFTEPANRFLRRNEEGIHAHQIAAH